MLLRIGDVYYRDGDLSTHTVIALGRGKVTVRRSSWGLAPSYRYTVKCATFESVAHKAAA